MDKNKVLCGEFALLKSLERRDALRYVESQIKAHHGQAQALIDAFAKHPGHRDTIECFIDHDIKQIALLRKMKAVLTNNNNLLKTTKTMEQDKTKDSIYYNDDLLNMQSEIADAFSALHYSLEGCLEPKQKEIVEHCLLMFNSMINDLRDTKRLVFSLGEL